jgi:cytochrome c oxidase subunit 1
MFVIGGLSGIFMANTPVDIYIHDTYFIVAHIHYVLFGGSLFAIFAGIYFWFPKMFGRMLNEPLGKMHFCLSLVFITLLFLGQMGVGYAGQPRRLWDPHQYELWKHLQPLNRWTSFFAFGLFVAQLPFVLNFFASLFGRVRAGHNPWRVGTLEWTVPSPPPYHNFDVIPTVVRGPHELGNPDVLRRLGRDWIGQTEALPAEAPTAPAAQAQGTT